MKRALSAFIVLAAVALTAAPVPVRAEGGNVPLMLLIGFGSLGIAFGLTIWTRRAVIRPVPH